MDAQDDDDAPYVKKVRPPEDTEIDITPMIDVTFQLLIFFMVTSTMQGNRRRLCHDLCPVVRRK